MFHTGEATSLIRESSLISSLIPTRVLVVPLLLVLVLLVVLVLAVVVLLVPELGSERISGRIP